MATIAVRIAVAPPLRRQVPRCFSGTPDKVPLPDSSQPKEPPEKTTPSATSPPKEAEKKDSVGFNLPFELPSLDSVTGRARKSKGGKGKKLAGFDLPFELPSMESVTGRAMGSKEEDSAGFKLPFELPDMKSESRRERRRRKRLERLERLKSIEKPPEEKEEEIDLSQTPIPTRYVPRRWHVASIDHRIKDLTPKYIYDTKIDYADGWRVYKETWNPFWEDLERLRAYLLGKKEPEETKKKEEGGNDEVISAKLEDTKSNLEHNIKVAYEEGSKLLEQAKEKTGIRNADDLLEQAKEKTGIQNADDLVKQAKEKTGIQNADDLVEQAREKSGIRSKDDLKEVFKVMLKTLTLCVREFMVGYREGRDEEAERVLNQHFDEQVKTDLQEKMKSLIPEIEKKNRRRRPKRRNLLD